MARSNNATQANYLSNASPVTTNSALTLACWFNIANTTASHNLIDITNTAGDNYWSLVAGGDVSGDPVILYVNANNTGETSAQSSAGYTANTWHHACGVVNSATSRTVYLNGGSSGNDTNNKAVHSFTLNNTHLGGFRVGATTFSPLNGSIAEVAVWSVALSAAEVGMLAKGFAPPLVRPDALVAYWPIFGRMASPEQDRWGNFHMTINGTMSQAAHVPRMFYPDSPLLGRKSAVAAPAFGFAHGAVQWASGHAAGSKYQIADLTFQPKAIRFYWMGLGSPTDTASGSTHLRRGVGFAASTSDRRCVGAQDQDTAATMTCTAGYRDDAVAVTVTSTPAADGLLDLDSINADGFTLVVDDAAPADITVFWEAWGGSQITVARTVEIAEPAATGDQDITVTGFTASAVADQVVMTAGCQETGAAPSASRADSGLCVGFAGGTTQGDNIVLVGNNDDASADSDTDGYCETNLCLAMIVAGGGNPDAGAYVSAWGTDKFTLTWISRGATGRKYIGLAVKGGRWECNNATIDGSTGGATSTVSGLPFVPTGACFLARRTAAQSGGTSAAQDLMSLGSARGTTSRRTMGALSTDGQTSSEINLVIEYDQCIATPNNAGAANHALDINAWNSDGFQLIVDAAGSGQASEWVGYLTFGEAPAGVTENATPVTSTATVVGPAITLSQASTPIGGTGAIPAPAQTLSQAGVAVTSVGSVQSTTNTLSNSPGSISSTGSTVAPGQALSTASTPVTSTGTVPAPTEIRTELMTPTGVSSVIVGPDNTITAAPAAVGSSGGVVTTATSISTAVSPVTSTVTIPSPTVTGTPLVENATPVVSTGSVVTPTQSLTQSASAVTSTGAINTPAVTVSQLVAAVTSSGTVQVISSTLGQSTTPVTGTGIITTSTNILSQAPGTVGSTGSVTVPTLTYGFTESPGVVGSSGSITVIGTFIQFSATPVIGTGSVAVPTVTVGIIGEPPTTDFTVDFVYLKEFTLDFLYIRNFTLEV